MIIYKPPGDFCIKRPVSRSKATCVCSADLTPHLELRSGMENHEDMGLVLDLKRPEDSNRRLPRVRSASQ